MEDLITWGLSVFQNGSNRSLKKTDFQNVILFTERNFWKFDRNKMSQMFTWIQHSPEIPPFRSLLFIHKKKNCELVNALYMNFFFWFVHFLCNWSMKRLFQFLVELLGILKLLWTNIKLSFHSSIQMKLFFKTKKLLYNSLFGLRFTKFFYCLMCIQQ